MTDPAQTKQDPLAALEEVLKNSTNPTTPADGQPDQEVPKPSAADQAAAQQQELADLQAKHQKQDEDQLQEQLDALHKIAENKPTPTAENKTETPNSTPAGDSAGYEINQLSHTKVQKDQ